MGPCPAYFKDLARKGLGFTADVVKISALIHCTMEYGFTFVVTSGPSMEPTIKSHDVIIAEHLTPRYSSFKRSNIVITRSPFAPNELICKRILALPGDKIRKADGTSEVIPPGTAWLEGDNEYNSKDSRHYGPVPMGLIKSRAILRIWPPHRIKYFNSDVNNLPLRSNAYEYAD